MDSLNQLISAVATKAKEGPLELPEDIEFFSLIESLISTATIILIPEPFKTQEFDISSATSFIKKYVFYYNFDEPSKLISIGGIRGAIKDNSFAILGPFDAPISPLLTTISQHFAQRDANLDPQGTSPPPDELTSSLSQLWSKWDTLNDPNETSFPQIDITGEDQFKFNSHRTDETKIATVTKDVVYIKREITNDDVEFGAVLSGIEYNGSANVNTNVDGKQQQPSDIPPPTPPRNPQVPSRSRPVSTQYSNQEQDEPLNLLTLPFTQIPILFSSLESPKLPEINALKEDAAYNIFISAINESKSHMIVSEIVKFLSEQNVKVPAFTAEVHEKQDVPKPVEKIPKVGLFEIANKRQDDVQVKIIEAFFAKMKVSMNFLARGKGIEESVLWEGFDSYIHASLYYSTYMCTLNMEQYNDLLLHRRVSLLDISGFGMLQLGLLGQLDSVNAAEIALSSVVKLVGYELLRMDVSPTPKSKLEKIINIHRLIVEKMPIELVGENASSADYLLPMLIYAILRTNPPRIFSNIRHIQRFRSVSKMEGYSAYCLTNISAAVTYLETVDISGLNPPLDVAYWSTNGNTGEGLLVLPNSHHNTLSMERPIDLGNPLADAIQQLLEGPSKFSQQVAGLFGQSNEIFPPPQQQQSVHASQQTQSDLTSSSHSNTLSLTPPQLPPRKSREELQSIKESALNSKWSDKSKMLGKN